MRICHVCNGHTVDDGRVFHRACCELAKAGYEVHLLAQGSGTKAYEEKGVVIHPFPEPKGRWQRYTRAASIAQFAADLKPDLFHVHEPDLLGPVIARAGTRPVIWDVHETYVDLLRYCDWIPKWMKPLILLTWDQWERRLVRRCAGVIVTTKPQGLRYSLFHDNVQLVANYPDLEWNEELPSIQRDGVTCVFAGVLRPDRGISQMFRALACLKERGISAPLALAGIPLSDKYLASLWDEAKQLGINEQVKYYGVLSKKDALHFQNKASIGLIADLPASVFRTMVPTKLMECMSLGLPVVSSDLPVNCEIGGESGAAIMVNSTKPEQIADAIESLVRNPALARRMGEAGREAVRKRFNWQAESKKLLEMYHELTGGPNGNGARN